MLFLDLNEIIKNVDVSVADVIIIIIKLITFAIDHQSNILKRKIINSILKYTKIKQRNCISFFYFSHFLHGFLRHFSEKIWLLS